MDEDPIDFSALDPRRNSARFEQMVRTVVIGARPPAAGLPPLLFELIAWGRSAVAVAALLALAAWLPSLGSRGLGEANGPLMAGTDPVELVSSWAMTDDVPPEVDLVQAMGGLYAH
jgi:hypothetical protein